MRNIMIAGVCAWAVSGAAAFSLGPAHGQVLLGRPIDVSFDVHLDPGMELETACLTARIVSGDNPLGSGQVLVTPLPSVAGRSPAVRVQSFRQADEPVLTIHLAAGCSGTITRTYVLLVDLPESIPPSTTPIAIPWVEAEAPPSASERSVAGSTGRSEVSPSPSRSEPDGRAREPGGGTPPQSADPAPVVVAPPVLQARPAQVPASAAKPRPAKPSAAPVSAPKPVGARLVMEPLAVVLAPDAGASAAASAPVAPTSSALDGMAPPAELASAPPPGASDETQPSQVLKDELAALRMQAVSDRAAALVLQLRLERIESERFHPSVVYGLLGVLAVMLAWMAWQVLRFRTVFEQSSHAWSESVAMHERKASGQND